MSMASDINPPIADTGATEEAFVIELSPHVQPPAVHPDAEAAGVVAAARAPSRLAAITVADGLMALVGGLALWLRFGELARLPLSAAEASAALANWQFWSAMPLDMPVASPAYFAFTHLIMSLGGSGDVAARFVPATFGLLTVLLPWLWRGRVRPVVWLVAGLFLAVSPMLVAVSRAAGGDAIALFALMLIAVAAGKPAGSGRQSAILIGIGLGLGLASSPLFYTGFVPLLLAAVVWRRSDRAEGQAIPSDQPAPERRHKWLRAGGLAGGITFVAVATSFLLYPAGIGAALRLFPAWLAQFGLPANAAALFSPFLALLRYEPAVLLLGLPALAWSLAGERLGRGLAAWLGLVLLVILAQSGVMVNTAAALLPAYLLVGLLAASLAAETIDDRRAGRRTAWFTAGSLLALGALLLAAAGRFARLNLLAGENATLITLALLAFVLAGMAVVLAMAWENPAARRGAFVGVAALLLFWQWGAAWQLSRLGANDPRERWVISGTDDDVPVLVSLLTDLSRQLSNSAVDLAIFSQVDSPVLRWYLRDFTGFTIGPALPVNINADVVITPAGTDPVLPNDYFGADFGLQQTEVQNTGPVVPSDVLKWWLFRESTAVTDDQRVVMWLRSDLARPE